MPSAVVTYVGSHDRKLVSNGSHCSSNHLVLLMNYEECCKRADGLLTGAIDPVRPGPGKFEGNEDSPLAEALYELSMEFRDDEFEGLVRVGRFLIDEDEYGFVMVFDYETEEEAKKAFNKCLDY